MSPLVYVSGGSCVKRIGLVIGAILLLLTGCVVIHDSPAPGCVDYLGPGPLGGCSGKTVILNLSVDPPVECLEIEVNNCNGGILEVHNRCAVSFDLGEITVAPGETKGVDVRRGENGVYLPAEVAGNFSEYVPEQDETIELVGSLGDQKISIHFTKTGPLCE